MGTLLLIYIGISLVIAGFGLAALYHARKYRYAGDKSGVASLLYLALFGLVFLGTLVYLGSNAGSANL